MAHNLGDQPAGAPVPVDASAAAPLFASRGATLVPARAGWSLAPPPHGSAAFWIR